MEESVVAFFFLEKKGSCGIHGYGNPSSLFSPSQVCFLMGMPHRGTGVA